MEIKRPGDVPSNGDYSSTLSNSSVTKSQEQLFELKQKPSSEESSLYGAMGAEFSGTSKSAEKDVKTDNKKNQFQPDLPRITDGEKKVDTDGKYSITKKMKDGNLISTLYWPDNKAYSTVISGNYPDGKTEYADHYNSENKLVASYDYYPDGTQKSWSQYNWEDGIYEKFTYNSRNEFTAYEMTENGKGIHRIFAMKDGKETCISETNIKSNFIPNGVQKKDADESDQSSAKAGENNQAQAHKKDKTAEDENLGAIKKPENGKVRSDYYQNGVLMKEVISDEKGVVTGVNLYNKDGSFKKAIPYKDGQAVLD